MTKPVLELSALTPDRELVTIEYRPPPIAGEEQPVENLALEMAVPDDLSLEQQQWFYSRAEKLEELMKVNSEETLPELKLLVNKAMAIILPDAPAHVLEALPRSQREQLVLVFTVAYSTLIRKTIEMATEAGKSISERSLADSHAFMGAPSSG